MQTWERTTWGPTGRTDGRSYRDAAFWKWKCHHQGQQGLHWGSSSEDNAQPPRTPGPVCSGGQVRERTIHCFCHLPLQGWLKGKKSLHKRYMCSFSGIITGPPRFSFRFQMRSDMFRLAHLCFVSTKLPAFYWQIQVSLNLRTIDAPKKSANLLFQSNSSLS